MLLTGASVKLSTGASPVAAITDFISAEVVYGIIPSRPYKDQEGIYTNKAINRIDIIFKKGSNATLDALVRGDQVNLSFDDGAIVEESAATVASRQYAKKMVEDAEEDVTVLSIYPIGDVTRSLHA